MQQMMSLGNIVFIRGGGVHTVNDRRAIINADMRLHAEVVLVAFLSCIAPHDYELAGRLPLQQAREILAELKRQMMGEGSSYG